MKPDGLWWGVAKLLYVPTGAEMSGRLQFILYESWAAGSCGGLTVEQSKQWEHQKVEKTYTLYNDMQK